MGVYHHLRNRRFLFRNHHFYSSQVKLREGGSPLRLEIGTILILGTSWKGRESMNVTPFFFGWGWKFKRQISRSCNQKHSKIEVDDRDLITLKRCFVSQLVQDSWNTPSHQHYQILIYKQFTSCLPPAYGLFFVVLKIFHMSTTKTQPRVTSILQDNSTTCGVFSALKLWNKLPPLKKMISSDSDICKDKVFWIMLRAVTSSSSTFQQRHRVVHSQGADPGLDPKKHPTDPNASCRTPTTFSCLFLRGNHFLGGFPHVPSIFIQQDNANKNVVVGVLGCWNLLNSYQMFQPRDCADTCTSAAKDECRNLAVNNPWPEEMRHSDKVSIFLGMYGENIENPWIQIPNRSLITK